jgi:tellurite resistance protein TehA-like permease
MWTNIFFRLIAWIYTASAILWAGIYFTVPEAQKSRVLIAAICLFIVGFLALGFLIFLFRRFPVENEDDKKE